MPPTTQYVTRNRAAIPTDAVLYASDASNPGQIFSFHADVNPYDQGNGRTVRMTRDVTSGVFRIHVADDTKAVLHPGHWLIHEHGSHIYTTLPEVFFDRVYRKASDRPLERSTNINIFQNVTAEATTPETTPVEHAEVTLTFHYHIAAPDDTGFRDLRLKGIRVDSNELPVDAAYSLAHTLAGSGIAQQEHLTRLAYAITDTNA